MKPDCRQTGQPSTNKNREGDTLSNAALHRLSPKKDSISMDTQSQVVTSKLSPVPNIEPTPAPFKPSETEAGIAAYITGCLMLGGSIPNPMIDSTSIQNMQTTMRIIASCLRDLKVINPDSDYPQLPFAW